MDMHKLGMVQLMEQLVEKWFMELLELDLQEYFQVMMITSD